MIAVATIFLFSFSFFIFIFAKKTKKLSLLFIHLLYFFYLISPPKDVLIKLNIEEGNFQKSPFVVKLYIENKTENAVFYDLKGNIASLDRKQARYIAQKIYLKSKEKKEIPLQFSLNYPQTYFLQVYLQQNNKTIQKTETLLAYQLEKIVSNANIPTDFDDFWADIRKQLDNKNPEFSLKTFPKFSNHLYTMYEVEMISFDGLVLVGWYRVPKKAGKHKAILQLPPLGGKFMRVYTLAENETYGIPPEYAVLSLNIRNHGKSEGHSFKNFTELVAYQAIDKEKYFYCGAIADAWRGLDFLAQRPEIDKDKIITEGASQGGGLALWLAGLDKKVALSCPDVMFLSDWEQLWNITSWVKFEMNQYIKQNKNITEWQIKQNLRYFDLKNIANQVKIPVLVSAGLQDWTCPAQTIMATYQKINHHQKEFVLYPNGKHDGGNKIHRKYKFQWIEKQLN